MATVSGLCGRQCATAMTVLLGNGDGTFTLQATPNLVAAVPTWVAVGRLQRRWHSRLVTANLKCSALVLLNQITETATATLSNVSVSGIETHQVLASYPGDYELQRQHFEHRPSSTQRRSQLRSTLSSSASTSIAGNRSR